MHCVSFSKQMCQDFCQKYTEFTVKENSYYIYYKDTPIKLLVNDFEWPGKGLHLVVEFPRHIAGPSKIFRKRFILGKYEKAYTHFDAVNEWVISNYDKFVSFIDEVKLIIHNNLLYDQAVESILASVDLPHRWDGQNISIKIGKDNLIAAQRIAKSLKIGSVCLTRTEFTEKFVQTYCLANHSQKQVDAQFGIDLINCIFGVEKLSD